LAVPVSEQRKLLQRSGNICAYPGCRARLTSAGTDSDPLVVVSEMAHIVAESPDGPRGASALTAAERNRYENLILLCNVHHELIDSQPATYTVEFLLDIKAAHERWVEQRLEGFDIARPDQAHPPVAAVHPETFRTVGSISDPAQLGIHPAIPLSELTEGLDPQLPTYIRRDVDADLRKALREELSHGGFVVLVGAAATGKTRTAYEAITAELPGWRIFQPTDASELNGLAAADLHDGRIVVWADDLMPLLTDPGLSQRAFRDLMGNPEHPVVIVGAMWPEHYEQLCEPPELAQPDPFPAARQLLKVAWRWDLASSLSDAELDRTRSISAADPRIREAADHSTVGESPIAVLACAPQLISRYTTARTSRAKAVVEAAVEARLCGHSRVIPADLLQQLAALRMTPEDKATASADWFSDAITWARHPVRGVASLLKPYAREIGELDGYEVSDIVTSHVLRSGFRPRNVQVRAWELLATIGDVESCLPIGFNALQVGNTQSARQALQRSAEAGVEIGVMLLGLSYLEDGDLDEALRWFTTSYDSGIAGAAGLIAVVHDRRGEPDEAKRWLALAAEAGEPTAIFGLGQLHEDHGHDDEAYQWYWRSAQHGFAPALTGLGNLHAKRNEYDNATSFWKQAAAAGEPTAMMNLARRDWDTGRTLGAERWWRAAAELGTVEAMGLLAERLFEQDHNDEALHWARTASTAGFAPAWGLLGQLLVQQGNVEEGLDWLTRGAGAGEVNAMGWLAELLEDLGDIDGAERWMQKIANEAADPVMHARYGIFLHTHGRTEEAIPWIRQALDSGDPTAGRLLTLAAKADPTLAKMVFPPADRAAPPKLVAYPERVHWTPIEQRCGCAIDWGWDQRSDPEAFMIWCVDMSGANCPWHGAATGQFPAPPPDMTISLRDSRSGVAYYARRATGADIPLGQELARQLAELMTATRDNLIQDAPQELRDHYTEEGYDPAHEWLRTRLTDIVLNRGSSIDWNALSTALDDEYRDARRPDDIPGDRPQE